MGVGSCTQLYWWIATFPQLLLSWLALSFLFILSVWLWIVQIYGGFDSPAIIVPFSSGPPKVLHRVGYRKLRYVELICHFSLPSSFSADSHSLHYYLCLTMVWLYLVQVNHAFSSRPASSSSLSKQDCIVSGIISTRGPGFTTIIRIRLPLFDSSTKGSTRTQSYVSQTADAMLILRSALSSCSEEGGDLTSPSYMPGGFKLCGFHGKTVDCTHTGTAVWNAERAGAERLQQTTLPSQAATEEHRKYCSSIFLYQVLMNRPCHQQSDVSVLIFRPYLRWWWQDDHADRQTERARVE